MKKLENAFAVIEHTSAMLAFWDKDLICRFANAAYIKWFGMSPADMIDKITLPQLLGPLYEKNLPYIKNALKGKPQTFQRDITLPNGETKNTIATYTPELINGIVIGFYVHVADVTPVKNEPLRIEENTEDPLSILVAHNYLNGVEYTLRASLFTKFPGIMALSKQYFVSPTKLKKDFKVRYGSTVFSYFRSLQMQVADKYIKGKIYSKNQLAEMFQFDNAFNFWKCYKKYFRSTPNFLQAIHQDPHSSASDTKSIIDSEMSTISDLNVWKVQNNGILDQLHNWQKYAEKLRIGTWERNYETMLTTWDISMKTILELSADFEPDINATLNFYKEGFDRELAKKNLDEAFTTGQPFDFQARIITAKGNEKIVRVLGFSHLENNACKRMHGVIQEIQTSGIV